MTNIKSSELNIAGSELFIDSESFLQDLTDTDAMLVQGGQGGDINKLLEFGISAYAINGLVSLAKSFSVPAGGEQNGGNGGGQNGGNGGVPTNGNGGDLNGGGTGGTGGGTGGAGGGAGG